MGLEIATTQDLLEMEERIMNAINSLGGIKNAAKEDQVLTLTQLRKTYSISHGSLTNLISSGDVAVITHSDALAAKRYFKESEIKKFFAPV
jgi:hypothetical protein